MLWGMEPDIGGHVPRDSTGTSPKQADPQRQRAVVAARGGAEGRKRAS